MATINISTSNFAQPVGVTVLATPDGEELTRIGVNGTHLVVDQRNATLRHDCDCGNGRAGSICRPTSVCSSDWWYPGFAKNRTMRAASLPFNEGQHKLHVYV